MFLPKADARRPPPAAPRPPPAQRGPGRSPRRRQGAPWSRAALAPLSAVLKRGGRWRPERGNFPAPPVPAPARARCPGAWPGIKLTPPFCCKNRPGPGGAGACLSALHPRPLTFFLPEAEQVSSLRPDCANYRPCIPPALIPAGSARPPSPTNLGHASGVSWDRVSGLPVPPSAAQVRARGLGQREKKEGGGGDDGGILRFPSP